MKKPMDDLKPKLNISNMQARIIARLNSRLGWLIAVSHSVSIQSLVNHYLWRLRGLRFPRFTQRTGGLIIQRRFGATVAAMGVVFFKPVRAKVQK